MTTGYCIASIRMELGCTRKQQERRFDFKFWHELERLSQRRERYAPASDCECTDEELEMAS